MLVFSLFISLFLAMMVYAATKAGFAQALIVLVLAFLAALTVCQSILLLLQCVLMALAVLSIATGHVSHRQFAYRLAAATVLAYMIIGIPAFLDAGKHVADQWQHPLESMADRLSYEQPVESSRGILA